MSHETVEKVLRHAVGHGSLPKGLRVDYDELHPLWGGSRFILEGTRLTRLRREPGQGPGAFDERRIGREDLLELAAILVEVEAWRQMTEDGMLIPDESRPTLKISCGGESSVVWERHHEMKQNGRLIRVREWFERVAASPLTEALLPDLEGERLTLTWDQEDGDSIVRNGDRVVWREFTGWGVHERFVEVLDLLQQRYGDRLADVVPTEGSKYALFGDSSIATFMVETARKHLRQGLRVSPGHETRRHRLFALLSTALDSTGEYIHEGEMSNYARRYSDDTAEELRQILLASTIAEDVETCVEMISQPSRLASGRSLELLLSLGNAAEPILQALSRSEREDLRALSREAEVERGM